MHEDDMDRFVVEQKAKLAEERRNLEMNPTSAVSGYYTDHNIDPKNQVNGRGYNEAPTQQKAFVDNPSTAIVNTRPQTPQFLKLGEDYKQFRNQLNQQRQREYAQQLNKNKPGYQNNPYQQQQQDTQPQQQEAQTARLTLVKRTSDLGMSLPIRDHLSAQERLRSERNREYNELLRRNQRGGSQRNNPPPPPQQQQRPQQQQQTNSNRPRNNLPPPAPRPRAVSPAAAGRRREPAAAGQRPPDNDRYASAARKEAEARELSLKARLDTDEYVKAKRREIDTYTESIQKRLEADEYANSKKREADEYVRAKKREAESYQELLERKRLEERLYRKDEEAPARGGPPGAPARRRPRRRRRDPYYDDGYEDDDDYYDALDEELYHRLKNRRPRVIRIEDDDDGSSVATPPVRKVSQREAPRSDRRKNISAEGGERSSRRNAPPETYDASYDTPGEVRSKSAPPEQEFTGLPIGERENYGKAGTALSKKEQYRRELEQQMRENQQKKISDKNRDRSEDRDRERQVAATDELTKPKRVTYADERRDDDGGRSYRAPPTAAAPAQANDLVSPHDQAYFYYGTRNPLDPSFGGGVPPGTSSVVGASYPPITPLAPTTQSSNARNSTITPSRKTNDLIIKSGNGSTGLFLSDGGQETVKQQKAQSYQEELRRQVEDKRREKELRKAEQDRYDRRKDAEAREYNPWGKGGGGAPMRDVQGNLVLKRQGFNPKASEDPPPPLQQHSEPKTIDEQLAENSIANLRAMRATNDDLGQNPAKFQQQLVEHHQPLISQSLTPRYNPDATDPDNTPRTFGRSNPFENKDTAHQKSQKDVYKEELQRQIDERKRVEADRKERIRVEEEKEEKRLEEQNRKMQAEFETEQKRKQEKLEEQKRKNEELQHAIEDQKRAEEQKRRENLSHRDDQIRQQRERELDDKLKQANTPRQSYQQAISSRKPVIAEGEKLPRTPAGRPPPSNRGPPPNGGATYRQPATNRQPTNRQQQLQQQLSNRSQKVSARAESPLAAPPRETPRYIYSRDSSRISRELSALRRQLLDEQRRIENQLGNDDDIKINSQIQDLSRLRQRPVQVVRRPRPAVVDSTRDFPDQMALKEFNDFKYQNDETSTLRIFKTEYPEQPVDSSSLEKQQAELIRTQVRNIEHLKSPQQSVQPVTVSIRREKPPSPPPIQHLQISYAPPRTGSPSSLLETETTYIPISDSLPPTPQPRQPARERRRDRRDKENNNENSNAPSHISMTISDVEMLAGRNEKRLTNLGAEDAISLTDPDDILNRFVNKHQPDDSPLMQSLSQSKDSNKRSASITTLESEPWLRPESRTT